MERVLADLIGERGEKAFEMLWRVAQGHSMPVPGTEQPGQIGLDRVPSLELQVGTGKYLIERLLGKTPDKLEVSAAPADLDLRKLSIERVKLLVDICEEAKAEGEEDEDPDA